MIKSFDNLKDLKNLGVYVCDTNQNKSDFIKSEGK